jgi:hypothetical protein
MSIIDMLSAKRAALIAAFVLALGAFAWFANHASTSADAAPVTPEAVSAVPAAEAEAFGALRAQSPATGMPTSASRFIDKMYMGKFGASSSLARRVTSPAEGTGAVYLIPARDAVCLYVEDLAGDPGTGSATCQPLSQVKSQGGIYLQLLDHASDSARSPFPPAGTPFTSTIVGVATADANAVAAKSVNGDTHTADVSADGSFTVTGTGLTELAIQSAGVASARGSSLAHG